MRAEIVATGTELLLGQIVDTNSTWLATQLAAVGVDCALQTRVGDNVDRIAEVLEAALARAQAVIVSGGLGPTQDDVTREAIAKVMGAALVDDPEAMARVEEAFSRRGVPMPDNNRRQGQVPRGAAIIPQRFGTAPGLICPLGNRVVYALPGVPEELREMTRRAVLPDLIARSGNEAVIVSRFLRTWGLGESRLAELIASRVDALEQAGPAAPTIAFLARGLEGVQVRVTVKAPSPEEATRQLDEEEARLRALVGDAVFGVDDETMEARLGTLLAGSSRTLAVAESFTGGLVLSRLVSVPGASAWLRGGIVAYTAEVKQRLLGVPPGPVVTAAAAEAMATGVRRALGADIGLSTTGVAGPDPDEGLQPGTAFVGLALGAGEGDASSWAFSFGEGRQRVRELGTMYALDSLRRRLEGAT